MHKFPKNLLIEWRKLKLPFENETFIVAVSGGADSVSLLLALHELHEAKKLKLNFIVAHFNHNLRGAESARDAKFVKNLAKKLNFEFTPGIQNSKSKIQNQKGNLEQSAREARYGFLKNTAEKFNAFAVLTAHTINDQAETFLLNLMRGSGLEGLGGMRAIRPLDKETPRQTDAETFLSSSDFLSASLRLHVPASSLLIRPLLGWAKREATENFARERGIEFCSDSMNNDLRFSRVRVRKKLIPVLREFNPKIIETLAQTAFLLREDAEQLAISSRPLADDLSLKELKTFSKSKLRRFLRVWLEKERGDLRQIDLKHIEAIETLIYSRKSGRKTELPGGEFVTKRGGKIYFGKSEVVKSRSAN